jgi:predicted RNA-binding protein with PUA-like domain
VEPQEEEEPESNTDPPTEGQRYWLMKAEPETRLENGHDVRFSIDDLASKSEPEPWDGELCPSRPSMSVLIDYRDPCLFGYLDLLRPVSVFKLTLLTHSSEKQSKSNEEG